MLLGRRLPLALVVAAVACEPGVGSNPNPTSVVDYAMFDPSGTPPRIPTPNDLALQPTAIARQQGAQQELLQAFAAAGGFPNDQEVPISIDFLRETVDPKTGVTQSAPPLDVSGITICPAPNCNVVVIGATGLENIDQPVAADYVAAPDRGTLTLHRARSATTGSRRWDAGVRYIAAIRGGPNGLKIGGQGITAQPTMFLLTQDVDLSLPQNQYLLPGSRPDRAALGVQLEQIRIRYLPAFAAIDRLFPHREIAVITTFQIAPLTTARVETDASAGRLPLPSDFLLDATGKRVQNISAFGGLAAGIATLDGFSTTAMILAQTSGPIAASSVTNATVKLYRLSLSSTGVSATRLKDVAEARSAAAYLTEPPAIIQSGASTAIGLQPAVPIQLPSLPPFALPPLEENTTYAVVITDGVTDTAGKPISRSTLGKILLFANPLVDAQGRSQLAGVNDGQAQGLDQMRNVLAGLFANQSIDKTHVAMAYTFRTQTVTGKNSIGDPTKDPGVLGLAALPYAPQRLGLPANYFTPGRVSAPGGTFGTPSVTAAFNKYGIEQSGTPTAVPSGAIQEIVEFTTPTVNLLSDQTGALSTTGPVNRDNVLNVLVAVPNAVAVANLCPTALGLPAGTKCAPLAIFHHGIGDTRAHMLTVANELNAQGIVVAALDSPKHGDRAYCARNSDCNAGGTCNAIPALAGQGDPAGATPGVCSNGLQHLPQLCVSATCRANWALAGGTSGQTVASSNFLVSANFFRTRDTLRQDVLDHSALIVALSPPTAGAPNSIQAELLSKTIFINPQQITWIGHSYGSILGTVNVAANPRISEAVLNAGGGTVVDVFATKGSAFYCTLVNLLTGLGVQFDKVCVPPLQDSVPATPADQAKFLQFLNVAKWVLDPADPINFAGHVTTSTLPNLLTGAPAQATKSVLGQMAECDTTVPNQTNLNLFLNMGLGPFFAGGAPATGTLSLFVDNFTGAKGPCVGVPGFTSLGNVPHRFIISWGISDEFTSTPLFDPTVNQLTLAAQDQAAAFLVNPATLPPNVTTR